MSSPLARNGANQADTTPYRLPGQSRCNWRSGNRRDGLGGYLLRQTLSDTSSVLEFSLWSVALAVTWLGLAVTWLGGGWLLIWLTSAGQLNAPRPQRRSARWSPHTHPVAFALVIDAALAGASLLGGVILVTHTPLAQNVLDATRQVAAAPFWSS